MKIIVLGANGWHSCQQLLTDVHMLRLSWYVMHEIQWHERSQPAEYWTTCCNICCNPPLHTPCVSKNDGYSTMIFSNCHQQYRDTVGYRDSTKYVDGENWTCYRSNNVDCENHPVWIALTKLRCFHLHPNSTWRNGYSSLKPRYTIVDMRLQNMLGRWFISHSATPGHA